MSAIISSTDREFLARPHIARAWFAELTLPSGTAYLHSGTGRITINGTTWIGVSDPLSGRLVGVTQVEEPVFGQANAVVVTLSGANKAFVQSVHATSREIEGQLANLYWAAFDGETQEIWEAGLVKLWPRGRMTAPAIHWFGLARRSVSVTIENIFAAQNFPPGGRWNNVGQQQRYPGDLGMEFVGVTIKENWN